jgi:DNA-binding transcriptional LysR family regulator
MDGHLSRDGGFVDLATALRSFVRVAETGSFSAVSRDAGGSQPTVSRHIALLERHFGVRLFSRTTRSLTITEEGRELLAYARQIRDTLESAEAMVGRRSAAPSGLVRIATPTAFGLYLITRLPPFLARYPELQVELVMRDAFGDMVEEGLDLAVRLGPIATEGLIARGIGPMHRHLVASPDYLARRGVPADLDALGAHDCIAYTYGSGRYEWSFQRGKELVSVTASGPFRANNSEAVHQAVLAGLGLGLLPEYQVRDDASSGRLRRVLAGWQAEPMPINVVYPGPRNLPLRSRTVLDFLAGLNLDGRGAGSPPRQDEHAV